MTQTVGELLALLGALCGAVSSLLYNHLGKKAQSDVLAGIRMVIATPIMCLFAYLTDGFVVSAISQQALLFTLLSGFIGYFITDLFMFRAYVSWGARETMVVMCLAPVFSGIASYFIFDEILTAKQIIGSLCSLLGVVIMTLGDRKKETKFISAGAVLAFMAAIFQSMSDVTAKFALSAVPYGTTAGLRAVGGVSAWIVLGIFRKRLFVESKEAVLKPKFLGLLFVTVMIGTVIGTTAAMGAIQFAPIGIVTSLKQMSPIFILIIEFFILKRQLKATDVIGTFVSVFGTFLLF